MESKYEKDSTTALYIPAIALPLAPRLLSGLAAGAYPPISPENRLIGARQFDTGMV